MGKNPKRIIMNDPEAFVGLLRGLINPDFRLLKVSPAGVNTRYNEQQKSHSVQPPVLKTNPSDQIRGFDDQS